MKEGKKVTILQIMYTIIPLAFSICPLYLIFSLSTGLLHGIFNGLITVQMNLFFNSIFEYLSGSHTDKLEVARSLMLFVGVVILRYVLNALYNASIEISSWPVMRGLNLKLQNSFSKFDVLFFEDPNHLNEVEKAKKGIENLTYFLNVFFTIITFHIPYFIFITFYMAKLNVILSIVVFLVFIPVLINQFLRIKLYSTLNDSSAAFNRKYQHYEDCIREKEFYKETRMLGAYNFFSNLFCDNIKEHNKKKWETQKKAGMYELGMKSITLIGYAMILFLLVYLLLNGGIESSAFAALLASLNTMFLTMEELISGYIGKLNENIGNIRSYIYFLRSKPCERKETISLQEGITLDLENVSFQYPNIEKQVLKDITLHIEKGERVAIVGENGSGKSTLVKVLSGLYIPTSGKSKMNGMDVSLIEPESLVSNTSGTFQNYQRYAISLCYNVAISDTRSPIDLASVQTNLKKTGIDTEHVKYVDGVDTMLTREFGGIDLSGGEWQKIAIARGIYRANSMIILDEPTSSIDPLEEEKLYRTFETISKGKTALIITHRLAAATLADRILVMEKGKIIEDGTHEELLFLEGKYAKLFHMQKSMYQY